MTEEGAETDGAGDEDSDQPERHRPPPRVLALILASLGVITVAGLVASALTPTLAAKNPQLLIILDARNRNLVLAREVAIGAFVTIGVLRRMLSDPLYYLLGYYYGDRAIRWLEVKAGMGSYARIMEKVFQKAGWLAVFLFPGPIVCAMAGVVRMRPRVFMALNGGGTLAAVIALRAFGDLFASPVDSLIGFFDRNLLVTTAASIALVGLSVVLGRWDARAREQLSVERARAELEGEGTGTAD